MKTPTLDKTKLEISSTDIVYKWGRDMIEWECCLTYKSREITVMFYTHESRTDEPSTYDVVYALVADDRTIESNNNFQEWCYELGYNNDSITDLETYELCKVNSAKVHELYGSDYHLIIKELSE
jgi:hypothetical protein